MRSDAVEREMLIMAETLRRLSQCFQVLARELSRERANSDTVSRTSRGDPPEAQLELD